MKILFTVFSLLLASSAFSQVAVVNSFQPLPGKNALTVSYMQEAKAIHDAMGVNVSISSNLDGSYGYAILAPSWEAYGQFAQSLNGNAAWRAFNNKRSAAPASVQTANLQLNVVSPPAGGGGPGGVSQITVWETTTGTMQALIQGGLGAEPIHEAAGASVSIYASGGNTMYYMQSFPNFAAWGKFRDTPNPEFNAYMQSLQNSNGGPGAVIIDQFTTVNLGP